MREIIQNTVDQVGLVVLGKEQQIKLAIACLLSEGHLLIEDMPGMGKTTLAHALAKVFNLSYNRIQFTNDILPSDISVRQYLTRTKVSSNFTKGQFSINSFLPMRSIVQHRRVKVRCWKPWKSAR